MTPETGTPAARLRHAFDKAVSGRQIGGSLVLTNIADLAFDCIGSGNPAQDAVAFALGAFLALHADDKDERIVTSDETYLFSATTLDHLTDAIAFLENGVSSDEAVRIIAALSKATPERLYRPIGQRQKT